MRCLLLCAVLLILPIPRAAAQPLADHHQHLFSPAIAALISPATTVLASPGPPSQAVAPITAADLVRHLDQAGIKRAAVLSTAYILASPSRKAENERLQVSADNDWTAAQVAQFPDRLVGFCSINPLKDYALEELARCAKKPNLLHGLKLHFAHSRVDSHNTEHIQRLGHVFSRRQRLSHGHRRPPAPER